MSEKKVTEAVWELLGKANSDIECIEKYLNNEPQFDEVAYGAFSNPFGSSLFCRCYNAYYYV
jgi:hypothetical protein